MNALIYKANTKRIPYDKVPPRGYKPSIQPPTVASSLAAALMKLVDFFSFALETYGEGKLTKYRKNIVALCKQKMRENPFPKGVCKGCCVLSYRRGYTYVHASNPISAPDGYLPAGIVGEPYVNVYPCECREVEFQDSGR